MLNPLIRTIVTEQGCDLRLIQNQIQLVHCRFFGILAVTFDQVSDDNTGNQSCICDSFDAFRMGKMFQKLVPRLQNKIRLNKMAQIDVRFLTNFPPWSLHRPFPQTPTTHHHRRHLHLRFLPMPKPKLFGSNTWARTKAVGSTKVWERRHIHGE